MDPKDIVDAILRGTEILTAWPVIVLFLIFFFRRQIENMLPELINLIRRLKRAEIGENKFIFEKPKTVQTPLGKVEYSGVPMITSNVLFDGFLETYVNKLYNFQISWPRESWKSDEELRNKVQNLFNPNFKVLISIKKKEEIGKFIIDSYIYVTVVMVGEDISINQFIDLDKKRLKERFTILSTEIDEATSAGFLKCFHPSSNAYHFERYVIASGLAYRVTATELPPDNQHDQQVRDELLGILNSFRVII